MKLAGKSVIVTGGSRGIGAALVAKLVREGARVVFTYVSARDAAEAVAAGCNGNATPLCADVRDRAAMEAAVALAVDRFGRLDVIVNNAHRNYTAKPFGDATWDDFQREFDTLIKGPINLVQAALPTMRDQGGGVVINIGSTMSRAPRHNHSFYVTAKCALGGLTEAMALELGKFGIRVNLVTPGPLDTEHNKDFPREVMARLGHETPLHGRIATVEEVADAVCLLAMDEARVVTGANLLASAGFAIA